ncbi:MAG: L,D-transpeptidase family protein [Chloroflexi bacterium]|nr:L,D-transpeptidase family protein [Chloroflexota bacterium]
MEQRIPLGSSSIAAPQGLVQSMLAGLALGAAVLAAVYLGLGALFLRALPGPAITVSVVTTSEGVPLDTSLEVTTAGWGVRITDVQLVEAQLDADGRVVRERELPVRYEPTSEGWLPGQARGEVVSVSGEPLLRYDGRYTLRVRGEAPALSLKGPRTEPVVQEETFTTLRRPVPRFGDEPVVQVGEPFSFHWSVPVASFDYTLVPDVPSHAWLSEDGLTAYIALDEFVQGTRFGLEITEARSPAGAPLGDAQQGAFRTPDPLRVVGFTPDNGASNIARGVDPIITFSAPVANPEAAERAIVVEPETPGHFEWPAPNRVQFVTDAGFPGSTDVRLTVLSGPDYLRTPDGGYVDEDVLLGYRTQPFKSIDVDLTRQTVTLLEDGRPVYTTLASTGVRGAETPTGHFRVQYKLPKTRMRGTNPDGHTYDIPDVPWVMALFGDYTFHGAPWRQAWGVPLSNGCISMPTANAKYVYDWTPVGTPVYIHY